MRSLHLCIHAPWRIGWQHGVLRSQKSALSRHFDLSVSGLASGAADILFYHCSEQAGLTAARARHKFLFCHDTTTLRPRDAVLNEGYHCVVNSELMRDMFLERSGPVHPVNIVHNYPDWSLTPKGGVARRGFIWLGRVTPAREHTYAAFIDLCRRRQVQPTVVSYLTPTDYGYPITHISLVPYDDLPDLLGRFEHGFGIGRSWLDLAIAGCKPVMAGSVIGPPVAEDSLKDAMSRNWTGIGAGFAGTLEQAVDAASPVRDLLLDKLSKHALAGEVEALLRATGTL